MRLLRCFHVAIFAVIGVVAAFGAEIATSWAGGDGSSTNPFQIANINQLRKLAADCNAGQTFENVYFTLTADVRDNDRVINADGSLVDGYGSLRVWDAIGREGDGFCGFFDGAGHSVSGIYAPMYGDNGSPNDYGVLFYKVKGLSNLTVRDSYYATMVQRCEEGGINNCVNYGTAIWGILKYGAKSNIIACGNYGLCYGSGIGYCSDIPCLVRECYNFGKIICDELPYCGIVSSANEIVDCMNCGEIVEGSKGSGASGIARNLLGRAWAVEDYSATQPTTVYNCVNYGKISNSKPSGAILVEFGTQTGSDKTDSELENVYWLDSSCEKAYVTMGDYGVIKGDCLAMTESEMKSPEFLDRLNDNSHYTEGWKTGNAGFPILEIIKDDVTASVESIETDDVDAAAVYYNIQGIRVENPVKGIYIKVVGNRAGKQIRR